MDDTQFEFSMSKRGAASWDSIFGSLGSTGGSRKRAGKQKRGTRRSQKRRGRQKKK